MATSIILVFSEKLNNSLRIRIREGYVLSPLLIDSVLQVLSIAVGEKNKWKAERPGRKK